MRCSLLQGFSGVSSHQLTQLARLAECQGAQTMLDALRLLHGMHCQCLVKNLMGFGYKP